MKNKIKSALEANLPILIIGRSGWGKSQMVAQATSELGYELVDVRLAQVPAEDIGGLPFKDNNNDSFTYLMPKWAINILKHPEVTYVLFLDEINQASPSTLNAIYSIVLDRKVAGVHIPNMLVVAAGNYDSENAYLSEIPKPLQNRFLKIEFDHDEKRAKNYLFEKYSLFFEYDILKKILDLSITTSPRMVEYGLILLINGVTELSLLNNCFSKENALKVISFMKYKELNVSLCQREMDLIREIKNIINLGYIIEQSGERTKVNIEDISKRYEGRITPEVKKYLNLI
jgi:hypothetical protein